MKLYPSYNAVFRHIASGIRPKRTLKNECSQLLMLAGRMFWNQTFKEKLEPKKNQNPEQEVHEIRQLLDEDDQKLE